MAQSLHEIGVGSLDDLLSTYAGRNADLGKWSDGRGNQSDVDLRLQYLGGWGINSTMEDAIYRQMLRYRQMPERSVHRVAGAGGFVARRRSWRQGVKNGVGSWPTLLRHDLELRLHLRRWSPARSTSENGPGSVTRREPL